MPSHLRISVIIPTLNESGSVAAAIQSVARAHEIVVVDGGSDDNTRIASQDAGATMILECEQGRGVQLQHGANQAVGDILLFMHADCYLHGSALQQLEAACDLAQARSQPIWGCFSQRIERQAARFRFLEYGNRLRAQWLRLPYGDQAIFVDRHSYQRVGGFPKVALMEDVLLSRRLSRLARPTILPGPVYVSDRRWKKNGVVLQTVRNWSILTAFMLGVPTATLAKWYRPNSAPKAVQEHV